MARYELTDAQYKIVEPLLSGKAGDVGRTGEDNRLFINGVVWILRSGAPWRDLPERYGKWDTVYQRFNRWAKKGVWQRVFEALSTEPDMDWVMLDSIAVRAHQHSAGQKKTSSEGIASPEALIGRSRGGLSSKIHVLLDALGNPCRILLSEAQRADIKLADELIRDIQSDAVIADKGYDSKKFIATIKERGAEVNRRVATRNYTARNYLAVVQIAAFLILLL